MNLVLLALVGLVGYVLITRKTGPKHPSATPVQETPSTEIHDGVRFFSQDTANRLLAGLKQVSLVQVGFPVPGLPTDSGALMQIVPLSSGQPTAYQFADEANKTPLVVALSTNAADESLTSGAVFLAIAKPEFKSALAGELSTFAILLDA